MARWSKRQSQASGRALGVTNSPNPTGDDGQWYAFEVEVGTSSPPVTVRLMVSTSTTGLWLVHPLGCAGAGPTCQDLRGALYAVYHNNGSASVTSTSSTYQSTTPLEFLTVADAGIGLPYSPREAAIGYSANSLSGTDNITLSLGSDAAGPTLESQTIFSYTANTPYVGQLGLWNVGYQVSGFTYPTILDSLVTDKYIPSATYAYTAGNVMDVTSPSLVLGGYDALRIGPQSVSVPFGYQGALAVSVSAITTTNDTSTNALMSGGPINMYIDSMVPEIWLPESIYTRFEDVYGITYDSNAERYLVSADQESELKGWNITLTMTIGSPSSGGSTVNISLPYSAFDQTASPPYVSTPDNSQTYYFPIRRATNSSNLILGRTFLQSAYLLTQNDLQTFNLSQAQVPSDQTQRNLIALDPTGAEISSDSSPVNGSQADGAGGDGGTSSGGGSNAGAIGGGVAGGVIAALLIILLGYFFWYRPRQRRREEQKAKTSTSTSPQPDSEPRGDSPANAAAQGPWPTAIDEKNAQGGANAENAHEMGSGDAAQDDRVHEMYVEPAEVEDTSRKPEVAATTESPTEASPVSVPEPATTDAATATEPKVDNKD